ncbi:unnamed protein product [Gordionus sp. m RMFG-2023]|uniref:regulator of nonsense transcripts 3B-like isoform X2 n=1 Tax=Gordionus sp. m RMFG-2023 TaxID=3053472 RepID=UPI0030E29AA3
MVSSTIKSESRAEEEKKYDTKEQFALDTTKLHKKVDTPPTKIIIRNLPPSMTLEVFLKQIDPIPEHDYLRFVMGKNNRAYINFINYEDIWLFKQKFDCYVFLDDNGTEYEAIVEYAPFQKIPKLNRRKDTKCGTIEEDDDFKEFLETIEKEKEKSEHQPVPLDKWIEEIELKEIESKKGYIQKTTPLLDFIAKKRQDRKNEAKKIREERSLANEKKKTVIIHSSRSMNNNKDNVSKDNKGKPIAYEKIETSKRSQSTKSSSYTPSGNYKNVSNIDSNKDRDAGSKKETTTNSNVKTRNYSGSESDHQRPDSKKDLSKDDKYSSPIKLLLKPKKTAPSQENKSNANDYDMSSPGKEKPYPLNISKKEEREKSSSLDATDSVYNKELLAKKSHQPVKFNFSGNTITKVSKWDGNSKKDNDKPIGNSSLKDNIGEEGTKNKNYNQVIQTKDELTNSRPLKKERPPIQLYRPGKGLIKREKPQ